MIVSLATVYPVSAADAEVKDFAAKCEAYMNARTKFSKFSGSVLLAKDGKPLFAKGYGLANIEHDIPNTPQTKFRLASVSKQFTAVAIMILEKEGKLAVDDPVAKHLPTVPEAWAKVTLHQLMSHTSGVPENLRPALISGMWGQTIDRDRLLDHIKAKPLDFKPGEKWSYSNTGYAMLGMIVERLSGKSYGDFLKERVFEPLGMKDTGIDNRRLVLKGRASGYGIYSGQMAQAQYIDLSQVFSAGSMYSTVEDMLKWDSALYTDKVLPQQSLERMWKVVKDDYGYGWMIRNTMGTKLIAHDGGLPGFITTSWRFPENKVYVAVLCNLEGSAVARVARDLSAIAMGRPYDVPVDRKEIKIDAKVLEPLVGDYEFGPARVLKVTKSGDSLYAQMTGQGRFQLYPESEKVFFAKVDEILATFTLGKDGKASAVTLHQNGADRTGQRAAPPWWKPSR